MLDMGFVRDIERIISKCHGKRQTLLFSATYNKGIKGWRLSTSIKSR